MRARDRSLYNKIVFFGVYRVLRVFYVGIWFYFYSSLLLVFSYVIPWYSEKKREPWIGQTCP